MDYTVIVNALVAIITNAPAMISEATNIYNEIKSSLSATDQSTIDEALAAAQASDAAATQAADQALDAASKT